MVYSHNSYSNSKRNSRILDVSDMRPPQIPNRGMEKNPLSVFLQWRKNEMMPVGVYQELISWKSPLFTPSLLHLETYCTGLDLLRRSEKFQVNNITQGQFLFLKILDSTDVEFCTSIKFTYVVRYFLFYFIMKVYLLMSCNIEKQVGILWCRIFRTVWCGKTDHQHEWFMYKILLELSDKCNGIVSYQIWIIISTVVKTMLDFPTIKIDTVIVIPRVHDETTPFLPARWYIGAIILVQIFAKVTLKYWGRCELLVTPSYGIQWIYINY